MEKIVITPKTKISELLDSYPELEGTLLNYTPVFKKLRNPILRKTIVKITTLQQASAIANVKVEELINSLRKEVGQEMIDSQSDAGYKDKKPEWFDEKKVIVKFDSREMLDAGEHPVNQVMSDLRGIKDGDIYELQAPFLPAPLIDKAASIEFDHWVVKKGETEFVIYFCNKK